MVNVRRAVIIFVPVLNFSRQNLTILSNWVILVTCGNLQAKNISYACNGYILVRWGIFVQHSQICYLLSLSCAGLVNRHDWETNSLKLLPVIISMLSRVSLLSTTAYILILPLAFSYLQAYMSEITVNCVTSTFISVLWAFSVKYFVSHCTMRLLLPRLSDVPLLLFSLAWNLVQEDLLGSTWVQIDSL